MAARKTTAPVREPAPGGFLADTTPTKDAVVGGLTHDATVEESIFDLIDNAIDAARNDLLGKRRRPKFDERGLPARYDGYKISLELNRGKLTVTDNCGGIDAGCLERVALRFGERSSHPYGLGTYGVGLNRAIFRLGKNTVLTTHNGSAAYKLSINSKRYLASDSWEIPVIPMSVPKTPPGTSIGITLDADVARLLNTATRVQDLIHKAQWRYACLLEKGLDIEICGRSLRPKSIGFRPDSKFAARVHRYDDGHVHVVIEYGEHRRHRFKGESEWSEKLSRAFTAEYGWNVSCNDRTILIADRSTKTGWPLTWHPEFYGFVGHVHFVANAPALLPWDTKKTGLDFDNPILARAIEHMIAYTKEWRRFTKYKRRNGGKKEGKSPNRSPGAQNPRPENPESDHSPGARNARPENPDSDHTKYTAVLPPDIDERGCRDKLLRMVREAKVLDIEQFAYSGLLLLRTLFELSTIHFLRNRKRYAELRRFVFAMHDEKRKRNGRAPLSDTAKLHYNPSFDEICDYFIANGHVWGSDDFALAKSSLEKARSYRKLLNDVAHNPTDMVDRAQATQVRDAIVPLLRHLLA